MAYFVTTALGRGVPIGDWEALHADTALKVLDDYHVSPFNPGDDGLALTAICTVTGLEPPDARNPCNALATRTLIESVGSVRFRITTHAIDLVRNAPGRVLMSGSFR